MNKKVGVFRVNSWHSWLISIVTNLHLDVKHFFKSRFSGIKYSLWCVLQ